MPDMLVQETEALPPRFILSPSNAATFVVCNSLAGYGICLGVVVGFIVLASQCPSLHPSSSGPTKMHRSLPAALIAVSALGVLSSVAFVLQY